MYECIKLLYVFFKIGLLGFAGGYSMLSMIMIESTQFGITIEQFADLNVLDMVIPGPIAINAATYVGYLYKGFGGALFATIGVSLPSFIIVTIIMRFISHYRENRIINDFLLGVKPAAVGLIAAAAMTIASGVLLNSDFSISDLISKPFESISLLSVSIFLIAAIANIRFKINPIILTVVAGIIGAIIAI